MDLKIVSQEIRNCISQYQKDNCLSFIEDTHTYFMKDLDGVVKNTFPSITTVLHCFYVPFDSEYHSNRKAKGNKEEQVKLLKEWAEAGNYSVNLGSRVHFLLEKEIISQYGSYKEVRQPIFECDEEQIKSGDKMVCAGKKFIDLMRDRGAVLLESEIVLGNAELGIVGQPDLVFLIKDKNGVPGIVITDWKTNKKSNMSEEIMPWTVPMLTPFGYLNDNALSHYKIQLPLYGKLLLKMLEGTKYENIKLLGCIIVHLTDEGEFKEYRVDREIIKTILDMDVRDYLCRLNSESLTKL